MLTAQDVFKSNVTGLPKSERLRLAALILGDLSASDAEALDYSDSWSEQDVRDVAAFSLQHAQEQFPVEDDYA